MADRVTITNMPSSGTPAQVAFQLYEVLRHSVQSPSDYKGLVGKHLALYAQCLNAAQGAPVDTSILS